MLTEAKQSYSLPSAWRKTRKDYGIIQLEVWELRRHCCRSGVPGSSEQELQCWELEKLCLSSRERMHPSSALLLYPGHSASCDDTYPHLWGPTFFVYGITNNIFTDTPRNSGTSRVCVCVCVCAQSDPLWPEEASPNPVRFTHKLITITIRMWRN